MWLFTQDGFLSIVADRDNPGLLTVRARALRDLEHFVGHCGAPSLVSPIEEGAGTDYRFRCRAPVEAVRRYIAAAVCGIDYPNFKARVYERCLDPARNAAYAQVWSAMRQLQTRDRLRELVDADA